MRIPRKHAVSSCYFIALNHLRAVFTYCKKRFVLLSVLYDSLSACYRRIQENRKWLKHARREGDRTPYICVLFSSNAL